MWCPWSDGGDGSGDLAADDRLVAPGADGMHGVRLANAIHLSSWKDAEVPLEFDGDEYLALLNDRIREEGTFAERA